MDRFARYWEKLYQAFPDARRQAAQAMGEAVQKDLNAQIQAADLENGAKSTVRSWQDVRIGSRGGYAAVSPAGGVAKPRAGQKQHTWRGNPVTQKQVTRWLERGHGTPSTGRMTQNYVRKTKTWHEIAERRGEGYVEGRQFYSFTRMKAWEHARKAADQALSLIADEVDF